MNEADIRSSMAVKRLSSMLERRRKHVLLYCVATSLVAAWLRIRRAESTFFSGQRRMDEWSISGGEMIVIDDVFPRHLTRWRLLPLSRSV